MNATDLRAWRARLGLSQRQAAAQLGVSVDTLKHYEAGYLRKRDDEGERLPAPIPRAVALACAALQAGLEPL